jgi:hypothetical protein
MIKYDDDDDNNKIMILPGHLINLYFIILTITFGISPITSGALNDNQIGWQINSL